MFPHIMVGANDVDAAEKFYTAAFGNQGSRNGDSYFYGQSGTGTFCA